MNLDLKKLLTSITTRFIIIMVQVGAMFVRRTFKRYMDPGMIVLKRILMIILI